MNSLNRRLIGKKPFEFSARVTLQLGRESISSSTVAISELIKNAYDADTEEVSLNFHLREDETSTLIINDHGDGMDEVDLSLNWLKIGTDNKNVITRSKQGRILTGAKGLGRLGIDRLCKQLILYTKKEGMEHALQLVIDWSRFEDSSLSLSDIEHELYEVELPLKDQYGEFFLDASSKGTRMVLVGLKDEWTDEYVERLENELSLLVSPFQSEHEFSINLSTIKSSESKKREISSRKILDVAKWQVLGEIDNDGRISIEFINNQKKITFNRANIVWDDWMKGVGRYPLFGPIKFQIYYFSQDVDTKKLLKQVDLGARDLKRFMELNRGFRIYRDHFRVRPYGEPSGKGDWLDLGIRKSSSPGGIRQGGWKIGPHQVLGAVLISRDANAALNDQANREGLVENQAFYHLRAFMLRVVEEFELIVHKDASAEDTSSPVDQMELAVSTSKSETLEAVVNLKKSVESVSKLKAGKKKAYPYGQLIAKKLQDFEEAQAKQTEVENQYLEALSSQRNELEHQKNTLSNLASLGILTICFGHEIRQHSGKASADAAELIACINDAENNVRSLDYAESKDIAQSISDSVKYIENFSNLALKNINPDKRTRKKINVPAVFEYVFDLMAETLSSMQVNCEIKYTGIAKSDVNVNAYEIDWESIAINLITNALWAMLKSENRILQLEFSKYSEDELQIAFRDSGFGIETGTEEDIFLPMKSSKRDTAGNVIGTGMGLAIVKSHVVDHMGGRVRALAKGSLGGAEFNFILPVR